MRKIDLTESLVKSFFENVLITEDCWVWTGRIDPVSRYGKIHDFEKHIDYQAHRVSWTIHHGCQIPDDKLLRHVCNNKLCVNPLHLIPGTHKENASDRALDRENYKQRRKSRLV